MIMLIDMKKLFISRTILKKITEDFYLFDYIS